MTTTLATATESIRRLTRRFGVAVSLFVTLTGTAFAEPKTFTCNPADVALFPGARIHVRCWPGDGVIRWFAFPADSPESNRMLSVLATALAAKKKLTIMYEAADVSGAKIGCETKDCRVIRAILMH